MNEHALQRGVFGVFDPATASYSNVNKKNVRGLWYSVRFHSPLGSMVTQSIRESGQRYIASKKLVIAINRNKKGIR